MPLSYPIIRSKRRTLSVSVSRRGDVAVRVPLRVSDREIQHFIEKHSVWIEKKVALAKQSQPPEFTYHEGDTFSYLGKYYKLTIDPNPTIKLPSGTKIWLFGENIYTKESEPAKIKRLVTKWYKTQAKQYLIDRVDYWAEQMLLRYSKLALSGANTRWGSCTRQGNIRLNWKLLMAPVEIIDYVIVHELSHLVHFNHSKRYWDYVARYYPDHRQARNWLNTHGHQLAVD